MSRPVDDLHAAVTLLRELAGAANPGPWRWVDLRHQRKGGAMLLSDGDYQRIASLPRANPRLEGTAEYLTAMQPGVAVALADWIAVAARTADAVQAPDGTFPPLTAGALTVARTCLAARAGTGVTR